MSTNIVVVPVPDVMLFFGHEIAEPGTLVGLTGEWREDGKASQSRRLGLGSNVVPETGAVILGGTTDSITGAAVPPRGKLTAQWRRGTNVTDPAIGEPIVWRWDGTRWTEVPH